MPKFMNVFRQMRPFRQNGNIKRIIEQTAIKANGVCESYDEGGQVMMEKEILTD